MKIIDLTDEHKEIYFVCLEDWSAETAEAGDHKRMKRMQNPSELREWPLGD